MAGRYKDPTMAGKVQRLDKSQTDITREEGKDKGIVKRRAEPPDPPDKKETPGVPKTRRGWVRGRRTRNKRKEEHAHVEVCTNRKPRREKETTIQSIWNSTELNLKSRR